MGKPYTEELGQLHKTIDFAAKAPIERLVSGIRNTLSLPFISIGSGGSFTTAEYAASLHSSQSGQIAKAISPMEAVTNLLDVRRAAVFFPTAGGSNPDVLGSFQKLVSREPRQLMALCLRMDSPLARLAKRYSFVDLIELSIPCGKDGFLATNSLIASVVLLSRAYAEANAVNFKLPSFESLLGFGSAVSEIDQRYRALWNRETIVVLHGPSTRVAAIDLESKFTEAALGNLQIADYRQFAHGRHHWIAKHADSTALIAFVSPDENRLASKTLELIPRTVPVAREEIQFSGFTASIAALIRGLYIVGSRGRAQGIDPGRPGVPDFGRKIYHLRAFSKVDVGNNLPMSESLAIERKSGSSIRMLNEKSCLSFWRKAYSSFTSRLSKTQFHGLVLDFDGTLCGSSDRFRGLQRNVSLELNRFLRVGIKIGIATGRGKSIRQVLQESIAKKYWNQVLVGYYNGSDIASLSDDSHPDGTKESNPPLNQVADVLSNSPLFVQLAKFECRPNQITVEPHNSRETELVWRLLQQLIYNLAIPGLAVLRSSHSMDVLSPGVDKRVVSQRLAQSLGNKVNLLHLGDQGQWPGNDHTLLSQEFALSVDVVSSDPTTCWNLAPAGFRCVDATLDYFGRLKAASGRMKFNL